jgi:exodeoxyribonuclease V beta subunit
VSTSPALAVLDGVMAIEASAGTGKTFTIEQLYLRLLLEHELEVAQVLVVTYTKAATAELRRRIRNRLIEASTVFAAGESSVAFYAELLRRVPDHAAAVRLLERALQAFDEAAIFTIHGFCQRVLTECAFESGVPFDAELVPDQDDLVLAVVDDFWRVHVQGASPSFVRYLLEKRWSPEWLREQVGNHLGRRYVRVVVPDDPSDLDALDARVAGAVAEVCGLWPSVRGGLADWVRAAPLSAAKYRRDHVAANIAAIEKAVAGNASAAALCKTVERFTSAELRAAGRKDAQWEPSHPFVAPCDELTAAVRERAAAWAARAATLLATLVEYAKRELAARKTAEGIQFYDDLLTSLARALDDSVRGASLAEAVRRRYPAALIDEFQDTDPVQYDVVRRIYGDAGRPVVLVGDPKQAIYSFRGADVFSYILARDGAQSHHRLDVNWRADAPVVQAVNTIFTSRDRPFLVDKIPFEPAAPAAERVAPALSIADDDGPPLRIWWLGGAALEKKKARERVYAATATEVAKLLRLGREGKATLGDAPVAGGHVAVLVRTNEEGRRMREALFARGVPSVQQAVHSVFDSREAIELERLLLAIAEPGRAALVSAALATEMLGYTAADLERLAADDAAWDERIERFHEYHHRWKTYGFVSMLRELLVREGVAERLLAYPDGERRMTNLGHATELLHAAAMRRHGGVDGLVEWLADARAAVRPAEMTEDEHLLRLESDANLVQIVTVHKAKGLQYPIVFCPFLWDGYSYVKNSESIVFHEPGANGPTLELGADEGSAHRERAYEEELAERLRLFYVALTRAEHRCYLVWGKVAHGERSALSWLFHARPDDRSMADVDRRYKDADPATLRAEVERVAQRSGGSIGVEDLPAASASRFADAATAADGLAARPLGRTVGSGYTIASFTALAAGERDLERPDFDQTDDAPAVEAEPRDDVHGFPRGARAGRCLHAILEAIDFTTPERAVVGPMLRTFGIDAKWEPVVWGWLDRILATPLTDDGRLRLADVTHHRRVVELEFYYPVRSLDLARLARELADAGLAGGAFRDAAARLPARTAEGFLTGSIDCVLEHDGRYFVLDYKSNRLGDSLDAYAAPALVPAMARGQYWLQYLIYAVAVHRWLGRRLVGYDYDRHFGGVRYLFLRGMDPSRGASCGVYADRPARAVIERLDAALGGDRR